MADDFSVLCTTAIVGDVLRLDPCGVYLCVCVEGEL